MGRHIQNVPDKKKKPNAASFLLNNVQGKTIGSFFYCSFSCFEKSSESTKLKQTSKAMSPLQSEARILDGKVKNCTAQ